MAIIKPTLSLTANSITATTDAGPMSPSLALSIADSLSVDLVEQRLITTSTTLNEDTTGENGPIDGSAIHGATTSMDAGTDGSFMYLKNHSTTTGDNIFIAIVAPVHASNDPATPATGGGTTSLNGTTQETLRTMTLKPGEFAWFPWDYTGDINWLAAQNNPQLEMWRFDRA